MEITKKSKTIDQGLPLAGQLFTLKLLLEIGVSSNYVKEKCEIKRQLLNLTWLKLSMLGTIWSHQQRPVLLWVWLQEESTD